jgi:hypothetical protein
MIIDPNDGGVTDYCDTNAGTAVAFSFVTATTGGITIAGDVYVQPLNIGADDYGKVLETEFEWNVDGQATRTYQGS